MKKTYNLLEESWIPCINWENKLCIFSLKEVILNAEKIRSLAADLPMVNGALMLFLHAFTSAIFGIEDIDRWEELYKTGTFHGEKFLEYAAKWHDRFDLFDETHPFFQDPKFGLRDKDLKNLTKGAKPSPKSFSGLLMHMASGSNATLFDHSMDADKHIYTAEETARLLIMIQAYSLGGMTAASIGNDKYYKDAPFSRDILFLTRGSNLFETLILNIPPSNLTLIQNNSADIPCWELEDPFDGNKETPNGLLDLATWQSRRILLIPEESFGKLTVRECFSGPGNAIVESFVNPFFHNKHENKGATLVIRPMRFQTGRVTWRDSDAILDIEQKQVDLPICIRLYERLVSKGIIEEKTIILDLFGMCTEPGQKKVYFYNHESFTAPAIYLNEPELLLSLKFGLGWAEDTRRALYFATSDLASYKLYPDQDILESCKPDKKTVGAMVEHFNNEQRFWSQLESVFYQFMNNLLNSRKALFYWQTEIKEAARDSLAAAAEITGNDPAGLKARAKAENKLEIQMSQVFKIEEKEE